MPTLQWGNHILDRWELSNTAVLLSIFVIAPITLILGKVIYNLYFHPLRKYPGPLLGRATGLTVVYYWWTGRHAAWIHASHEKYGPVVRQCPNDLSYVDPQAWKDIYGHRRGGNEFSKDSRHTVENRKKADNIISAGREKHSQLRKLLSNAFSDKSMREQEPIITHYVDFLISRLEERCEDGDKPLDMLAWYNFTTFDIIGHLAFDESFDCLKYSDYHPWVKFIFSTIQLGQKFSALNRVIPRGTYINKLLRMSIIPKNLINDDLSHGQLIHEKLAHRKGRSPGYTDFMTHLIQAEEKGALQYNDLEANAQLLVIAGSETTATVLTGATYLLLTNPLALARLTSEIRSSFKSTDAISFATVSDLPYLLAVLDESMRIYPAVATTLHRTVPPEGAMVCGDYLPGGTTVGVNMYSAYRASQNWEDPDVFRPERFMLEDDGGKDPRFSKDKRDALQPFSMGPRNCIGRNLAYIEMRLILTKILWSFDLELCEGNEDPTKQKVFGVWEKKPLMVKLTPVKH